MNTPRAHFEFHPSLLSIFLCMAAFGSLLCVPSGAVVVETGVYAALKSFQLSGGSAVVENLSFKRDRAQMTFHGTFYFAASVSGRITGAVFLGRGTFRAEAPPSDFERDSLRRLLKTDVVESDFETAVLRFSDDSFDIIGRKTVPGNPSPEAAKLASEFDRRFLKETGANISARLAVSLLNQEAPGFFLAQFDKGKRGRFNCRIDHQGRIPAANFGIDGGEKGLIFAYRSNSIGNDVWMAFYSAEDYARGNVVYSDALNLFKTAHYKMNVDLREPKKLLRLALTMRMECLAPSVRAIPFNLSESLSETDNSRLKKAMRVKSVKLAAAGPLDFAQEDWEGGVTVFLADAADPRQQLTHL